jgi:hypothetical protein
MDPRINVRYLGGGTKEGSGQRCVEQGMSSARESEQGRNEETRRQVRRCRQSVIDIDIGNVGGHDGSGRRGKGRMRGVNIIAGRQVVASLLVEEKGGVLHPYTSSPPFSSPLFSTVFGGA